MTIEEIRKGAPSGANRYFHWKDIVIYFKKDFINWSYWHDSEFMWISKKIPIEFRLKTKPLF